MSGDILHNRHPDGRYSDHRRIGMMGIITKVTEPDGTQIYAITRKGWVEIDNIPEKDLDEMSALFVESEADGLYE